MKHPVYIVNHHQERKSVLGQICNALVDKNAVNTEMKRLSVKYVRSKGVLMLPIQQTIMYSNLVMDGREVDGVTHVWASCIL